MIIEKLPSPNFFIASNPIEAVCLHGSGGPARPSLDWLRNPQPANPDAAVSANYFVEYTGQIWELVDWIHGKRAWCNGKVENFDQTLNWLVQAVKYKVNPNLITVSIEHEASSTQMRARSPMTDKQFNSSIELTAFVLRNSGLKASHQTVIGHNQISGTIKFNCPGVIFPPAYTEVLINRNPDLRP